MAGIYVHIPFCSRKCIYCDFFSVGERLADWPRIVSSLINESRARVPELSDLSDSHTIYIGGGTPSLMPIDEFLRLAVELTLLIPDFSEFTIEVNPDDVTDMKACAWRDAGVNRVSIGVQSLVDSELSAIGRRHDAATARNAYAILHKYFDNISIDLMFGLPHQTPVSLLSTLQDIIEMRPQHVSAYSLMYEERTAITRMRDAGKLTEIPEEDSLAMFRLINEQLAAAGYEQYEISNYSLPGFRSKHNASYWQGVPYVGLGPGAHSFDGRKMRSFNRPDIKAYARYWLGESDERPDETELLDEEDLREEYIMTRLRTREGIDIAEYGSYFGMNALRRLQKTSLKFIDKGLLHQTSAGAIALTKEGIMISDEIIIDLF